MSRRKIEWLHRIVVKSILSVYYLNFAFSAFWGVTAQRLSSQWYNISVICAINNKVNILYRVNRHLQGLTPRLFTSCLYSTFQSLECWFLMLFIIIHTVVTDFSYKLIQFYFDFTSRK